MNITKEERGDLEQFVRELDADMFVQYPIQPNESDEIRRERVRVRKNFDLLQALLLAPAPEVGMADVEDIVDEIIGNHGEGKGKAIMVEWLRSRGITVKE